MQNAFYFASKALFFSRYLSFSHVTKWFDRKDKINFKFYKIAAWETNNCHTHITQYLKKQRQSNNKSWSINRMQYEEPFSRKIMLKMELIN